MEPGIQQMLISTFLKMFDIYTNAQAVLTHNGVKYIVIQFWSGVLQGCPGSAFLFNNALDPFFRLLVDFTVAKKAGLVRACADDIGAALRAAKYLKGFAPILALALKFGGLKLKPAKCKLIVLCEWSDEVGKALKQWLAVFLPEWSEFQLVSVGKYLGFFLGPDAGKAQWVAPLDKFWSRVKAVQASRASISITAYTYNSRIVPVLGYVAQLLPLPPPTLTSPKGLRYILY